MLSSEDRLNQSQINAVNYRGKNLLVLAGAGSGKTRTIIARAQKLIEEGVSPGRIVLLTFTRRASMEMIERLKRQGTAGSTSIIAGTFHYFSLLMMRKYPHLFSNSRAMIIDRNDQEDLMKLSRAEIKDEIKLVPKASQLLDILSYSRNSYTYLEEYLQTHTSYMADACRLIIDVLANYQKKKETLGYLDFDDLLFYFLQKLEEDSAGNFFRQAFDHILVDEMQDTNPLQWAILKNLINPAALFCVGDDAQSIYAFRGADFRNVHEFQNRIPNSDIIKLEKNYRSSDEIINLANHLLERSPLNYNKTLESVRGSIGPVILKDFSGAYDEAGWIVEELKRNYASTGFWSKQMIMLRTAYAGKILEGFLIEHKIPYRFIGGVGLLQSAHIKDLLAFCRAALNLRDQLAWIRYLSLWSGLGERRSVAITLELAKFSSLAEADEKLGTGFPHRNEVIKGCIDNVHPNSPVPEILKKATAFLTPLLEERYSDSWYRRVRDFDVLVGLSQKYKSVQEFIETYTLDPISASLQHNNEGEDAVTLITIHSAKGTEADTCYIIQAQAGNYPHRRSLGDENAEEEERRILYVAITRAINKLIITRSAERGGHYSFGSPMSRASRPENDYFLDGIEALVKSDDKKSLHAMINTFPFFKSSK